MSNQENNQKQIQFPAQQELKHLRTRCGKVYALGNNRFRAVVQTTPVHEYDAATHQWVELSAEKRQQMAAQAYSPIATFADSANSAENAAGILDTYVKEGSGVQAWAWHPVAHWEQQRYRGSNKTAVGAVIARHGVTQKTQRKASSKLSCRAAQVR